MFLTLLALYACNSVIAQPLNAIQAEQQLAPGTVNAAEVIQESAVITAQPEVKVTPLFPDGGTVGPIALLLPLQSASFGAAAAAVQLGFMAAANLDSDALPVRTYDMIDEEAGVVSTYREALANGAQAVVGPLTRNGVTVLSQIPDFTVPTLSLNIPELPGPGNLYFFGMAIEAEARQIARLAKSQGMQQAIVITSNDMLAHRLQFSFENQWTALGGRILREIEYSGDTSVFSDLVASPESMVFFATNAEKSRAIRPFLPVNLSAYGTSQLFVSNTNTLPNFDLEGVRFVDMPWLIQTDQASVSVYPRAIPPLAIDKERLYALGVDAYRLIKLLLNRQTQTYLQLDGVTGQISLDGQTFYREAVPALFVQGHGQAADAPIAKGTSMFPERPGSASSLDATPGMPLQLKP